MVSKSPKVRAVKQTIAVDIDDVLSAENDAMREFINERYGLSLSDEDYQIEAPYWGYWEHVWKVDKEEGRRRYEAYVDSGAKSRHRLIEGAEKAIRKLEKSYKLVIVTSRDDFLVDMTHRWLERNFPSMFQQVAFVAVWSGDQKASKAAICKAVGADYLIDDNLEHCSLAAKEGITALLFGDYGWNRAKKLPANAIRVKDWQEVEAYFEHTASR